MICATPPPTWGFKKVSYQQLTPCLQACSFKAFTQVLCQCSLKDLKENREVNKPLTPASEACRPSQPERSLTRKPHTPPPWLCWGCLKENRCQAGPPLSCLMLFLVLQSRSTVFKYWKSHPSTMSREARKRPTRHSQPKSWSSITASWSLSYHQVQMEISGLVRQSRSAPFTLWVAAHSQSLRFIEGEPRDTPEHTGEPHRWSLLPPYFRSH